MTETLTPKTREEVVGLLDAMIATPVSAASLLFGLEAHGLCIAPVEPTEKMIRAMYVALFGRTRGRAMPTLRTVYYAAIKNSPFALGEAKP